MNSIFGVPGSTAIGIATGVTGSVILLILVFIFVIIIAYFVVRKRVEKNKMQKRVNVVDFST